MSKQNNIKLKPVKGGDKQAAIADYYKLIQEIERNKYENNCNGFERKSKTETSEFQAAKEV
jgi:hypothetical protein